MTGVNESSVADGVDWGVEMWGLIYTCVVSRRELVCGFDGHVLGLHEHVHERILLWAPIA